MNTASKLGAFGLVLVTALGGGAALGSLVGPSESSATGDESDAGGHAGHDEASSGEGHPGEGEPGEGEPEETMPGGVLTSQAGYTFEPGRTVLDGSNQAEFDFRIIGPDGASVRQFEPRHERELHLILVGSDLGTFAHLHPSRDGDGSWTVQLPALAPGVYRAYADFAPTGGPELTLGVDLAVPGSFAPAPLPPSEGSDTVDGYQVTLSGSPAAGADTEVVLEVSRGGEPVTDLEPYLGAFGHLVAIRAGDLAYLHVHPLGEPGERGGPEVPFMIDVPSHGDYRLFFDFAHGGGVHTAAFTVEVPAGAGPSAPAADHGDHAENGAATEEGP